MSTPNLDSRYAKPTDIAAAIAAQATTDAGQYSTKASPTFTGTPTINGVSLKTRSGSQPVGQGELFFNVKDYGALGDGSTDDGTAIRSALSAASTSGGVIWFPVGTYRIVMTSTLTNIALSANTTLRGSGAGSVINVDSDASGAGIYRGFAFNNGNNVTIESLTVNRVADFGGYFIDSRAYNSFTLRNCVFNGNNTTYTTNLSTFFHLPASGTIDGILWENITVNAWKYGWVQDNSSTATPTHTVVRNCRFMYQTASDLEFNSPSGGMNDVIVEGCTFTNNQSTSSSAGWGIGFAYVSHARIQKNRFNGYYGEAIHIEDWSFDFVIDSNTFEASSLNRAAHIYMLTGCYRIRIERNYFDGTANTATNGTFINGFSANGGYTVTAAGSASVGTGVTLAIAAGTNNIPSGTALTFTGGGVFTTTTAAAVGATSITGNLVTAAIASNQTATIYFTPSGHNSLLGPSYVSIVDNDMFMGTYVGASIYLGGAQMCNIHNNRLKAAGFVTSGVWSNPAGSQNGMIIQASTQTSYGIVITGNSLFGLRVGIEGTPSGNVICFGHGSVISDNTLIQCNLGIDARNAGAASFSSNIMYSCVTPLTIGTASTGSGTVAHPVAVTGNVAYNCTNAMNAYNATLVTAGGTVATGSSVSVPLASTLSNYLKTGAMMQFSSGGVLTLTADAAVGASSLTGNLTSVGLTSGQTAYASGAFSQTTSEAPFVTGHNLDTVLGITNFQVSPVEASRTSTSATVAINLMDSTVFLNNASMVATLPTAAAGFGRRYTLINTNGAAATIQALSGNILGSTTYSLTAGSTLQLMSDGSNYYKAS